jgi:metal-responsive CopG/Arc/MetJ family transcriptional regulator
MTKNKRKRRLLMPTIHPHSLKAKITVTVSQDLVRQMDKLLDVPEAKSRSRLVEEAIRYWLREQAYIELERQTEAYYQSLSKAERKENRDWSKIATRSAKELWNK